MNVISRKQFLFGVNKRKSANEQQKLTINDSAITVPMQRKQQKY